MDNFKTLKLDSSFRPVEVIDAEKLTIDHIKPRSKGGKNTWFNLVTACKKCNQKKGDRTPIQANMKLIREPYRPKTNILRAINKSQINPIWKDYLWNMC
jgi:5-methylcytosine-specific restriction endonuclease McrA